MTTDRPPTPPQVRRSLLLASLRWFFVILLVAIGFLLLLVALAASPCRRGGMALVVGVALLGWAVVLSGLPNALIQMTPWRPTSLAWLKNSDGCAATFGLCLVLLTIVLIPDLAPTRVSCNESAAIADLRAFANAETAYSKLNAGHFDARVSCLHRPGECIPGLRADYPGFITEEQTAQTRNGYRRALIGGPAPSPRSPTTSETSVSSFAYTAEPTRPMQTGVRGFCTDATGIICYTTDGTAPPVMPEGTCDVRRGRVIR